MYTHIPSSYQSLTNQNDTRRRWICLLVIVALIASSLFSSVVVLNPQYFAKQSGWLTGQQVLICTSEGLRWTSVSTLKQDSSDQHSNEHQSFNIHCPIFKLHDSKGLSVEGDYTLAHYIQFVGFLGGYSPLEKTITNRLYLIAPKHSPPLSLLNRIT